MELFLISCICHVTFFFTVDTGLQVNIKISLSTFTPDISDVVGHAMYSVYIKYRLILIVIVHKYIMRYISTQKWIWMKYLVIEWFGTCQSKINRYASGEGGFRKTCKRSEGIIQCNCGSGVIFQNVYLGKLCSSLPVKG